MRGRWNRLLAAPRSLAYAVRAGPLGWLLAIAGAALVVAASIDRGALAMASLCGPVRPAALAGLAEGWWRLNPPEAWLGAWLLMLAAMMPPLLAAPVAHLWQANFPERRARALTGFALGYAAIWLAAGLVLVPLAAGMRLWWPSPGGLTATVAAALVWSASPAAQQARNRCHRTRRISAGGLRGDRDCVGQGIATALPCLAVCWPWMLVPLMLEQAHVPAMALVTALLFCDRLARPRPPRWRLPFFAMPLHGTRWSSG